ncbi:hypothetical protein K435DRAFT_800451 [Dendrothele bispora CBS 962.96]|uniref:Uncharacterized protein n=1 Tax=Dendrothele bispora (strain CBS 962.96) TaxID=1314807 RepID=A0A4S8LT51_DENBC|nr:hypothetical protein K435DRAFT_800451 [Dendrothele bispora CBS 962.96]
MYIHMTRTQTLTLTFPLRVIQPSEVQKTSNNVVCCRIEREGFEWGQWTGNRTGNWALEVSEGFGRRLVRQEGSSLFKDDEVDEGQKNNDANDDDGRDDREEKGDKGLG